MLSQPASPPDPDPDTGSLAITEKEEGEEGAVECREPLAAAPITVSPAAAAAAGPTAEAERGTVEPLLLMLLVMFALLLLFSELCAAPPSVWTARGDSGEVAPVALAAAVTAAGGASVVQAPLGFVADEGLTTLPPQAASPPPPPPPGWWIGGSLRDIRTVSRRSGAPLPAAAAALPTPWLLPPLPSLLLGHPPRASAGGDVDAIQRCGGAGGIGCSVLQVKQ